MQLDIFPTNQGYGSYELGSVFCLLGQFMVSSQFEFWGQFRSPRFQVKPVSRFPMYFCIGFATSDQAYLRLAQSYLIIKIIIIMGLRSFSASKDVIGDPKGLGFRISLGQLGSWLRCSGFFRVGQGLARPVCKLHNLNRKVANQFEV